MLPAVFREIPALVAFLNDQSEAVYLVGGAVRDMLRNRPTHDLDFVVLGNASDLARRAANTLHGAFYRLDSKRDTARVLLEIQGNNQVMIDFTRARGGTLETDLRNRDFTINAIAYDLRLQHIVDPLNGLQDLQQRVLRACSPASFQDDPVRLLRALRFSLLQELRIEPQTLAWLYQAVPRLIGVSGERMRDELFRLLEGGKAATALRLLQETGLLDFALPELVEQLTELQPDNQRVFIPDRTFAFLQKTDLLLDLAGKKLEDRRETLHTALLVLHLATHRDALQDHLEQKLNPYRSLRGLLIYTALFLSTHLETGGASVIHLPNSQVVTAYQAGSRRLALSNIEILRGQRALENIASLLCLLQQQGAPDRAQIYHLFNESRDAGIDMCLFGLAALWAEAGVGLPAETWLERIERTALLFSAWWERRLEWIDPPPLVSGDELLRRFSLSPSPLVGSILGKIREAQATGQISNRTEAFAVAEQILRRGSGSDLI